MDGRLVTLLAVASVATAASSQATLAAPCPGTRPTRRSHKGKARASAYVLLESGESVSPTRIVKLKLKKKD